MGHTITVTHVTGDQFDVDVRGHRLVVDQPRPSRHLEAGPSPVEMWVAALAACVAHTAHRVLVRADPSAGLVATCEYELSDEAPWRVEFIDVELTLPALSPDRLASIRRAVDHCTVGQSLKQPPEVAITLRTEQPAMPATAAPLTGAGGGRR